MSTNHSEMYPNRKLPKGWPASTPMMGQFVVVWQGTTGLWSQEYKWGAEQLYIWDDAKSDWLPCEECPTFTTSAHQFITEL